MDAFFNEDGPQPPMGATYASHGWPARDTPECEHAKRAQRFQGRSRKHLVERGFACAGAARS